MKVLKRLLFQIEYHHTNAKLIIMSSQNTNPTLTSDLAGQDQSEKTTTDPKHTEQTTSKPTAKIENQNESSNNNNKTKYFFIFSSILLLTGLFVWGFLFYGQMQEDLDIQQVEVVEDEAANELELQGEFFGIDPNQMPPAMSAEEYREFLKIECDGNRNSPTDLSRLPFDLTSISTSGLMAPDDFTISCAFLDDSMSHYTIDHIHITSSWWRGDSVTGEPAADRISGWQSISIGHDKSMTYLAEPDHFRVFGTNPELTFGEVKLNVFISGPSPYGVSNKCFCIDLFAYRIYEGYWIVSKTSVNLSSDSELTALIMDYADDNGRDSNQIHSGLDGLITANARANEYESAFINQFVANYPNIRPEIRSAIDEAVWLVNGVKF